MSSTTVSVTPAGVTVTVDGATVHGTQEAGTLTQGVLYRSATGRTWLYDPAGDSYAPWVRVLGRNGRSTGATIGKRYADTADNVSFPVTPLTEGAAIQR